jgi:hypothetical protein
VFEKELADKFKKIFEVTKVTYDQPSDLKEQECIFIEIEDCKNSIKDGRALAKVTGNGIMFGNGDKLPFGFFSKAIKKAEPALKDDLFFFDIESNTKFYRNIVQRGFSFVYFFNSQYDPEIGSIESVEITVTEES